MFFGGSGAYEFVVMEDDDADHCYYTCGILCNLFVVLLVRCLSNLEMCG